MTVKVIPGEQTANAQRWDVPSVQGAAGRDGSAGSFMTAEQLEKLQAQAREEARVEGHELGRREGLAAGQAEMQRRADQLGQIINRLTRPLAELDARVEEQLVALVIAMARQLVRREIKTDPGQVIAVVREAMSALPLAGHTVRLSLHPEDAALVREALAVSDDERSWKIVEDPVLTRGDCRVSTENSQIDATLETRLAAVATQIFGGDREGDDNGS